MDKPKMYAQCSKCGAGSFASMRGDTVACRNCGLFVTVESLCRDAHKRGYESGFSDGTAKTGEAEHEEKET